MRELASYPRETAAPAVPLAAAAAPAPERPRWAGWASALAYLMAFILFMVVADTAAVVAMSVARLFTGKAVPPRGALMDPTGLGLPLWSGLFGAWGWCTLIGALALTAAFGRLIERRGLGELGLRMRATFWRDLVVGTGLAILLFVSVVGVGAGKGWFAIANRLTAVDAMGVTLTGFLLLFPLAAVEEVAIRGYLLHALGRSFGPRTALIVSSSAFALLHGLNPGAWEQPLAMAGIFLAGLYLGSAYLITGNLWLPIFLHTGWNLLEGPVFGLPVSGMPPPASVLQVTDTGPALWTGGRFGPEAGLLLCLMLGVHLTALWAMRPLLQARPEAAEGALEPAPVAAYRPA